MWERRGECRSTANEQIYIEDFWDKKRITSSLSRVGVSASETSWKFLGSSATWINYLLESSKSVVKRLQELVQSNYSASVHGSGAPKDEVCPGSILWAKIC